MTDNRYDDFPAEEYWVVRPDGQRQRLVLSDRVADNIYFAGFAPEGVPLKKVSAYLWRATT